MKFHSLGKQGAQVVMLLPGLGVSYEVFMPLIGLLEGHYHVIAAEVDGFTLGTNTHFTSIDDQAAQVARHITEHHNGKVECIYGLSMGGKILSRLLERGEVEVAHAIMDAAPLMALPRWLAGPFSHLQSANVWSCFHHHNFWHRMFHSHYFDVLLDECRKVYPWGGGRAVREGYKSVYANTLQRVPGTDIHYWYGTKEAFASRAQARHLNGLHPETHIAIFPKMNHGELLIEHPEEVAKRIEQIINQ